MDKIWVEKQKKQQAEEIAKVYKEIEQILRGTNLFDEDDIKIFISDIAQAIKMGFTSPIYLYSRTVLEKYQPSYNNNPEAFCNFDFKVREALKKIPAERLCFLERMSYERYLDSEPVFFDGDIIITDPCYIIKDNTNDWENSGYGEEFEAIGIEHFMTRDTIFGDWSCSTYDLDTKEKIGDFCADAGMVSVLLLDEVLKYNPSYNDHLVADWTTTWIKNFKGTVQFVVKEVRWILDEDIGNLKKGQEMIDYEVKVVGHGIDKVTGKPINFIGTQTGI